MYKCSRYLFIATLMLSGCLSGCFLDRQTTWIPDSQQDQPWIGVNTQAEGVVVVKTHVMGGVRWLEWEFPNSRRIDSRSETKRLSRWLQKQGDWDSLTIKDNMESTYKVNQALVIVALKPTVVVTGPGITYHYDFAKSGYGDGHSMGYDRRKGGGKSLYVELTRGFRYGGEVPWSEQPMWFSPDLKEPWQAVPLNSDGERVISVPWGELVLERHGEVWQVRTRTVPGKIKG
jgi:hypothetical protein